MRITGFVIVAVSVSAHGGLAQGRMDGEGAARKVVADYAAAENKHDIPAMVALFRNDAVFRTVQGFISKGKQEIERPSQNLMAACSARATRCSK